MSKRALSTWVSSEIHEKFREHCNQKGVSISEGLNDLVYQCLGLSEGTKENPETLESENEVLIDKELAERIEEIERKIKIESKERFDGIKKQIDELTIKANAPTPPPAPDLKKVGEMVDQKLNDCLLGECQQIRENLNLEIEGRHLRLGNRVTKLEKRIKQKEEEDAHSYCGTCSGTEKGSIVKFGMHGCTHFPD